MNPSSCELLDEFETILKENTVKKNLDYEKTEKIPHAVLKMLEKKNKTGFSH